MSAIMDGFDMRDAETSVNERDLLESVMSESYQSLGKKKYHCHNDCQFGGCPGHEMELRDMKHSDGIEVAIDGEDDFNIFDRNEFKAMVEIWDGHKDSAVNISPHEFTSYPVARTAGMITKCTRCGEEQRHPSHSRR